MRNADQITVEIVRFGSSTVKVDLPEDATLTDALNRARISLSSTEKAYVDGVEATPNSILDDGDSIQIVGKKEGGLK